MIQIRIVSILAASAVADINLATFDGADGTTLNWHEQNDPVMGGQSIGTFVVDTNKQVGIMNGTVKVVPDLGAPGVIRGIASGNFNDVSTCKNIVLNVNSETAYPGYKVTIGSHTNAYMPGKPFYQYGYRAEFQAPVGTFGDVVVPFNLFTIDYDLATGKSVPCAQNASVCPPLSVLKNIQEAAIEARAVEGDVHIEVKSIRGSDCSNEIIV
jgi:hypothetical protein